MVVIRRLTGQESMGQILRAPPTRHAREHELNALRARRDRNGKYSEIEMGRRPEAKMMGRG